MDKDFSYQIDNSVDCVVDELGNSAIMLRKVGWGGRDPKLEVRKWYLSGDTEKPNKGVTFLTEDGPSNLAKAIIRYNYGDTESYLRELKNREDFYDALGKVIGKQKIKEAEETENEEYYDPREVLVG